MNTFARTVAAATLALAGPATYAVAQQVEFPEKCKAEMSKPAGMEGHGMDMPGMAGMSDHQKESMEGMKTMHMNMMQGMMKEDADVAFACGMIAHHMGAISMAEVELKHGDNEEAEAKAQKTIDDQTKDIEELAAWVEQEVK